MTLGKLTSVKLSFLLYSMEKIILTAKKKKKYQAFVLFSYEK